MADDKIMLLRIPGPLAEKIRAAAVAVRKQTGQPLADSVLARTAIEAGLARAQKKLAEGQP